ncbi:hypothetical protein [Caldisalinibacter kiritimatiensis]|uniref:Uncharacterized protein n=1 Tax=Caldisalinibacter kiritimatiensis TaxID=1304284 RepID=R1CAH6_9FIRM|nr:hypothetical protein [Caldisalinibacter kiritimatiensis]EOC99324.1 hypothetical protein L21TH_2648 [Caldisalinibacter kiritimatiensis]
MAEPNKTHVETKEVPYNAEGDTITIETGRIDQCFFNNPTIRIWNDSMHLYIDGKHQIGIEYDYLSNYGLTEEQIQVVKGGVSLLKELVGTAYHTFSFDVDPDVELSLTEISFNLNVTGWMFGTYNQYSGTFPYQNVQYSYGKSYEFEGFNDVDWKGLLAGVLTAMLLLGILCICAEMGPVIGTLSALISSLYGMLTALA